MKGFGHNSSLGQADYTANQHHLGDAQGLVGGWASKYKSSLSPGKIDSQMSKQKTQTSTIIGIAEHPEPS